MEYLDKIKKFSFNNNLQKYSNYVDFFYKLNLDKQTEIIAMMIDYKKYNYFKIKNGNLDKLYDAYKILLHKLEYNELNNKEREIYENINAYLIIDNEFSYNDLFKKYINKYMKNINSHNFNRKIFLIMQDILNILNNYYKKNIKFLLVDYVSFAGVNWFDLEYKNNILLNKEKFIEDYYSNDKKDIIRETVFLIFVVCHEFEHIIQREIMYRDSNNALKYQNDLYIMGNFNNFYNCYHDNFNIEKEANNYAILNALELIKKYFKDTLLFKSDLKKIIYDESDMNIKNEKEYLIKYKLFLSIIKLCQKLNIENYRLKEMDDLYKTMKKTFN